MLTYIERLRHKPKIVRQQVAFGGAFVMTSIIALIWLVALPDQFQETEAEEVAAVRNEVGGSFSLFWNETKSRFGDLSASVKSAWPGEAVTTTSTSSTTGSTSTPLRQPAVIMPDLTSTTTFARPEVLETAPLPRQILIATTSSSQLNEDED